MENISLKCFIMSWLFYQVTCRNAVLQTPYFMTQTVDHEDTRYNFDARHTTVLMSDDVPPKCGNDVKPKKEILFATKQASDSNSRNDYLGQHIWARVSHTMPYFDPVDDMSLKLHMRHALRDNSGNCSVIPDCSDLCTHDNCLVCQCHKNHIIADCTSAGLTTIPDDLPQNISHLLLAYNNLSDNSLYPRVFAVYPNLEVLQLDSNNISTLPEGVFEGLEKLVRLNVYNNSIAMDAKLNNSRVFAPLNGTLECLVFNRNNKDPTRSVLFYPDFALSFLSNLKNLYLDGLQDKSFSVLFGLLKHLTHLTISGYNQGYCNMGSLRNDTFKYLRHLKHLNISDCGLNGSLIENGAFSHLTQLVTLDLSNNFYLGLEAIGQLMYGLRNSRTFHRLKIQRVVPRFAPCILVLKKTLAHLKNTSLHTIEAMDNEIETIEFGALNMLPPTLTFVNLTDNKIMFGSYWRNMAELVGLKYLHLDGFFQPVRFPMFFPESRFHCENPSLGNEWYAVEDGSCLCGDDSECEDNTTTFILPLPPKLKQLTMHSNSMAYNIRNISFCSNNSLQHVDLSSNHFQNLTGPVTGLNHLKFLNLSSCFIEFIGDKFFDNLTSLEHLNLYQNLLGDCLNGDLDGLIFDKLTNITRLNISFNNLYRLNKKAFADMSSLETLDLSINRLSHANFSISHMTRLRFIDLHRNEIASLPSDVTKHISWLRSQGVNITVDMRQNPIECDCGNLDFLKWVVDKQIFGTNYSLYYCKFPVANEQAHEMVDGYEAQVNLLSYSCYAHVTVFLTVAGGTFFMVLVLIISLIYRFRWTLRYWYHAAKIKISSERHSDTSRFKYDVFVSYANKDIEFVLQELCPKLQERNIKVFLHGEKFKVGRYITDNIYKAVVKSRKTLVVITSHMLASHWCNYELQMAKQEGSSRGRNVLVFLFLEEIPSSKLGATVLAHIQSSTYIIYPKLPQHKVAFWDKLADDLISS
ncbi:hypothetical protein Btru_067447 [Bulinus truncatus]|nr:hypothetical protein Btru_067447 [Bulinus truncatus]